MDKIKVFIHVVGGNVESVFSDHPEVLDVCLHDTDNVHSDIEDQVGTGFGDNEDKIDAEIDRLEREADAAWDEIVKGVKECEINDWQI